MPPERDGHPEPDGPPGHPEPHNPHGPPGQHALAAAEAAEGREAAAPLGPGEAEGREVAHDERPDLAADSRPDAVDGHRPEPGGQEAEEVPDLLPSLQDVGLSEENLQYLGSEISGALSSLFAAGAAGAGTLAEYGAAGAEQVAIYGSAGAGTLAEYGAAGAEQVAIYGAAGAETLAEYGAVGAEQVAIYGAAGAETLAEYGAVGAEQVAIYGAAGAGQLAEYGAAGAEQVAIYGAAGAGQLAEYGAAGAEQVAVLGSVGAGHLALLGAVGAEQVALLADFNEPEVADASDLEDGRPPLVPHTGENPLHVETEVSSALGSIVFPRVQPDGSMRMSYRSQWSPQALRKLLLLLLRVSSLSLPSPSCPQKQALLSGSESLSGQSTVAGGCRWQETT
ncbi:unnamed protein product [Prorocentrum cordatum]|uniref:Subtilisin n=1 Tax=Prorocentrum cordatum TaxID=2364126 RepID=A0ABN9W0H3_9DINO|nr:unnamed protein product [Polarella glacialis]